MNPLITSDPQTRCMQILELSYKNLPDCLKACFLCLVVFQEDKEIPIQISHGYGWWKGVGTKKMRTAEVILTHKNMWKDEENKYLTNSQ